MNFVENPIIKILYRYNLIKKKDLIKISNNTRDKKIEVYQDKNTKIIFLKKLYLKNKYSNIKYNDFPSKDSFKKIKVKNKIYKVKMLRDENLRRRINDFKSYFDNKHILDFGAGWGGFLSKIKKKKTITAFELRNECLNFLKKKKNKYN